MRLVALLAPVLALASIQAGSASTSEQRRVIHPSASMGWASRYMIGGFQGARGGSVWQPSIFLRFGNSPFSASFWSALPVNRSLQENDELSLFGNYGKGFYLGTRQELKFSSSFCYWFYPRSQIFWDAEGNSIPTQTIHGNKLMASVSFPKLLPLAKSFLVPGYQLSYLLYWERNQKSSFQGGAHHEFSLNYYRRLPMLPRLSPVAGAGASLSYQDGPFGLIPGWTHAIAKTEFGLSAWGFRFTFGLNQQWASPRYPVLRAATWTVLSAGRDF